MTNEIDLNKARSVKKNSKNLSAEEKSEIIKYLKDNPDDINAFSYLMNKYNISNTTIGILVIQDTMRIDTSEEGK